MLSKLIYPLLASALLLLPAALAAQSSGHGHGHHHHDQQPAPRVVPVAPPPGSMNDFIDNGNGTITDRTSGLMWKKCSEGQTWSNSANTCTGEVRGYSWVDALDFVGELNQNGGALGHNDWRLPTIKELSTLVDYNRRTPIDEDMFPNTPGRWFWSSTPFNRSGQRAWFVAFGYGDISMERIENVGLFVRLVRDAEIGDGTR